MKPAKHLLWLSVILLSVLPRAEAQESGPQQSPPKYRLELVYVFDAEAVEFVFVIGNVGFKSVESLKKFLSSWPPGTTFEWAPGCKRIGGEPLLSSEQEMKNFKAFCATRKIDFILVPSG